MSSSIQNLNPTDVAADIANALENYFDENYFGEGDSLAYEAMNGHGDVTVTGIGNDGTKVQFIVTIRPVA